MELLDIQGLLLIQHLELLSLVHEVLVAPRLQRHGRVLSLLVNQHVVREHHILRILGVEQHLIHASCGGLLIVTLANIHVDCAVDLVKDGHELYTVSVARIGKLEAVVFTAANAVYRVGIREHPLDEALQTLADSHCLGNHLLRHRVGPHLLGRCRSSVFFALESILVVLRHLFEGLLLLGGQLFPSLVNTLAHLVWGKLGKATFQDRPEFSAKIYEGRLGLLQFLDGYLLLLLARVLRRSGRLNTQLLTLHCVHVGHLVVLLWHTRVHALWENLVALLFKLQHPGWVLRRLPLQQVALCLGDHYLRRHLVEHHHPILILGLLF